MIFFSPKQKPMRPFFYFLLVAIILQTGKLTAQDCSCHLHDIQQSLNLISSQPNSGKYSASFPLKLVVFETQYTYSSTIDELRMLGFAEERVTVIDTVTGKKKVITSFFFFSSNEVYQHLKTLADHKRKSNPCWIRPWPGKIRQVQEKKKYILMPTSYDRVATKSTSGRPCSLSELLPSFDAVLKVAEDFPGDIKVVIFVSFSDLNPADAELKSIGFGSIQVEYASDDVRTYYYTTTSSQGYQIMRTIKLCDDRPWRLGRDIFEQTVRVTDDPPRKCRLCPPNSQ